MRPQFFIQHVQHIGDGQIFGVIDRLFEITPEILQQRGPVKRAGRHFVKLGFQLCGKIIFDIAVKEITKKRRDQPAAILGNEPGTIFADIITVLQDLNDRCVSRGPTNPQLFHPLDKARIRKARRWLGEMLFWGYLFCRNLVAFGHLRQQTTIIVFIVGFAAFLAIGGAVTAFLIYQ